MKLYPFAALFFSVMIISSCSTAQKTATPKNFPKFYKEGHRGTRGLMQEYTIPSMIKAIESGANVIEVDVYTSKDGQVFIAHDPMPNINHTFYEDGKEITAADAKKYIFHQMNYADIRKFDVGSKPYPAYPQQERVKTYMPLLGLKPSFCKLSSTDSVLVLVRNPIVTLGYFLLAYINGRKSNDWI